LRPCSQAIPRNRPQAMQMVELAVEGLDRFHELVPTLWPGPRHAAMALPNVTTFARRRFRRLSVYWAVLSRLK
jgi:hypothetical protein